MKKLCAIFALTLPIALHAETLVLNFKSLSVVAFAQATYKEMMKRDYVISPELLAMDKTIAVSVKSISAEALPKFVEGVLSAQGITSVQRDGIYYLGIKEDTVSARRSLALSGPVGIVGDRGKADQRDELRQMDDAAMLAKSKAEEDFETEVYRPINRNAAFVSDVVNAAFQAKPASVAGGLVVLNAPAEKLKKASLLAKAIDVAPHKIKISATFVEVSSQDAAGLGISVVADLLGAKLGIRLGDSSGSALSLKGNNFQVVLDAIASDGRFKQVANPTALVDDYEKTAVNFGDKVPTIASTTLDKNGNPLQQVAYQQSGVVLNVTPRVLGSGKINLSVDGQVSSFSATTTGVTSSPTLSNRQIQTSLTMNDGEILIIGGLSSNKSVASSTGLSFLPKSWAVPSTANSNTDLVLVLAVQIQE
ncbi:type II secretion system protein GspD [Duganella sp. HH101]|uniref:type II secretion system protein GspD n=1 Tax=Duganella sp. HH101 TaxID=1781066 RepID=UPI00087416DA|nr:hypothetical protein [Duganella sp. HH101]OFA02619.1 type II secretion system protein D precursor [Duganella sp. HH101]